MVVIVFVSTLTINLSLVMADVSRLIVQVHMEGAQAEDFETPIVAILDGKDGKHIEQNVLQDTHYLVFDGLTSGEEYSIRVQNKEKIFDQKTFTTASESRENGSVSAYAEGKTVHITAWDVALGPREFYSVVVKNAQGTAIFGADSDKSNDSFTFTPNEPTDLYITVDIGGKVCAVCELKMKSGPIYDFENGVWNWTEDLKATVSFAELYGGEPLVIPATVTEKTTLLPSCETVGEKTFTATATYEGVAYTDVKTAVIPAAGHMYGEPSFKWTQTENGYVATAEFTCLLDGHKNTVTADVTAVTTNPTCEENGYVIYTATVTYNGVDYTDVTSADIPALGHSYGSPITIWTETENGYTAVMEFNCSRDGHKETVNADISVSTVEPTCEEEGYTAYTAIASFEGEEYSDVKTTPISALGHEYGELIAEVPPTYDEPGMAAHYHCSVCGKYFDVNKNEVPEESLVIGALGHTYSELIAEVPATCEEPGMSAHYVCEDCGKYFDIYMKEVSESDLVIPPTGHTYGELIAEVPATCEEPGTAAHYHCEICGKYFDVNKNEVSESELVIPPAGHTYGELIAEVPATCEEPGTAAHYHCAICGKYFNANYGEISESDLMIPPTGHTYGELIAEVPATCEESGTAAHYHCAACGKYFDVNKNEISENDLTIAPLGHSYGSPVFVWTETSDGFTATAEFTCTRNSDHKETVTAEVAAVTTAPTCEENGYVTYTATVVFGNESYSDEKIVVNAETALGHEYGDPKFIWTETSDGYTATAEFTCIRDSHKETVTAEVTAVTTDPTCEEDGYVTYTATVLFGDETYGEEKTVTNEGTALGHSYGSPVFTWTETSDGFTATAEFTCARNTDHKKTVTAEVTAVTTDPTCEDDGYVTYTATAVFGDESYSEDKVVTNEDT
ncbi:MAG: hypothetical protein J5832_05635, partial [Clostridia bacterium]|nr:hypothetical protein [Clostridia bacterium]